MGVYVIDQLMNVWIRNTISYVQISEELEKLSTICDFDPEGEWKALEYVKSPPLINIVA